MATKAELLEQARERGLDVKTDSTKAELESMLNDRNTSSGNDEQAQVSRNEDGEATNGTSRQGDDSPIDNTDSIPQNDVDRIDVRETTDNPVAKRADAERTKEEIEFADESNPNQKARNAATEGAEYDQDGNPRTGGKSYGVSEDDVEGTVFDERNKGEAPEDEDEPFTGRVMSEPARVGSFINPSEENDTNNQEWSVEDQQKLEDSLSSPGDGIRARVTTSAGSYVRIKFFHNNKPLGTYRSRNFKEGEAQKFLSRLREERDV